MYQGFEEIKGSGTTRKSGLPDTSSIYAAEDPRFLHFPSRRSVVHSAGGMVSSTQPLANEAGYRVLAAGGNAADAAVAMAAALNVTEPSSTGVGGDLFCLFYEGATGRVRALNGSGRAPAASTLEAVRAAGIAGPEIPYDDILGATVPGAAAGLVDVVERFGSGALTLAQILQPAIDLAETGFPVSEISAYQWQASENLIRRASDNHAEILSKSHPGRAPRAGEIMKNPTLAETFRTIAREGKDGFYRGRIAEEIVKLVRQRGGLMTLDDLANHTSTPCEPISVKYAGLDVWEHPPNGQGLVALLTLGLLDILQKEGRVPNLSEMDHNSAEYLHVIIECLRIAFADCRYHVTDPEHMATSVEQLLSPEYLKERAAIFDPTRCRADIKHGSPENSSDTVYFSTVDADGNACSFIISNYAGFGTAAVPKGCGFTLQNRGCNFTLKEGHPNCIAPNKRPYHTIIPAMVTREDQSLWACYGVMGAFMQPQGHVQVLCNMIHHNLTPQTALDAPRVCVGAALPDVDGHIEAKVYIEDGISDDVMNALRQLGHDVEKLEHFKRGMFGRGQVIRSHVDGDQTVLSGGSDPRGDGAALPCTR
ncbi:Gamma-glutamyltranspeptidase [Taphrina deformans PYCC 5710]|uniref:Gamma-glutamyltranspeptidase n=1 Tax=Taphrina deformans (strain PYCC 5710 / ATCC 11124 / CBS 356.35 / IMI 108563 / JCM 9778 / NBRC 8474) TaxID=1097556 RepID=R4X8P3_TAPDE|nr:Gamma-glutamyltranspeptidase [Taphrina deformans PYCC 5710]|eukprot:CCG82009.1 Gamma-glutamyltranspeptidase [Taphrina deformans PYCC 5710]